MTDDEVIKINLKAITLEKEGETEEAIKLFELAISNNFIGNGAYERLRIHYKKNKEIDNEIRVLEKAIYVFENIVYKDRADRLRKLQKFQDQLQKVLERRNKLK